MEKIVDRYVIIRESAVKRGHSKINVSDVNPHAARIKKERNTAQLARAAEAVWLVWHLPYHYFRPLATPHHI